MGCLLYVCTNPGTMELLNWVENNFDEALPRGVELKDKLIEQIQMLVPEQP